MMATFLPAYCLLFTVDKEERMSKSSRSTVAQVF